MYYGHKLSESEGAVRGPGSLTAIISLVTGFKYYMQISNLYNVDP